MATVANIAKPAPSVPLEPTQAHRYGLTVYRSFTGYYGEFTGCLRDIIADSYGILRRVYGILLRSFAECCGWFTGYYCDK